MSNIDASQYIGRAHRRIDGKLKLVDINYHDPTWPEGYDKHYNKLKSTIESEGIAYGLFDEAMNMMGFVAINRMNFGMTAKYCLLDQLFLSLDCRGKGFGKKLFEYAVKTASEWQVDKIYICAGSAEETIAFYTAIGCQEASEINMNLYEEDPNDLQLEYVLSREKR